MKDEDKVRVILETINSITTLIALSIQVGGLAVCMYFVVQIAQALAGQATSVGLSGFADLSWLSYVAVAVCGVGWWVQRKSKRDAIESFDREKKELEDLIDPERSSSGMLRSGKAPEVEA